MASRIAALRLNQPRISVLGNFRNIPMAVGTAHAFILGHNIPQAFGGGAGMAVITTIGIRGDIGHTGGIVVPMHGVGQVINISDNRGAQGV